MSNFIDKLKQASQLAVRPMGFRAAQRIPGPRLMLIARLSQYMADTLDELVAGADAGLLTIAGTSGAKKLGEAVQSMPGIPWGVWADTISRQGIKQLEKAGGDFLVYSAGKMPLSVLGDEKLGRILAIEPEDKESLVSTINELPVDAVLVNSPAEGDLTWHDLMLARRFAGLLAKPVLFSAPGDISQSELQLLWDMGIDGLVVTVTPGQPADGLKELRQTIDRLTPPSKSKRLKSRALVPSVPAELGPVSEGEEEEEYP